ncbi:hypothetical protein [Caballeronia sordidicola]|uniref:hypothetical protein n=1 Tax=Caballeronia sordidicola TaxID=196367 RepID=UPI000B1851BA|nr:hypothetical protein [Caballeronia sordidicola]
MSLDEQSPSVVERYLALLGDMSCSPALESTRAGTSGDIHLSDAAITGRIDETSGQLRRIIHDYLDDAPDAHTIADKLLKSGDAALHMLRERDEEGLNSNNGALAALETIVRVDGSRPSFLVRDGVVDHDSGVVGNWAATLDASADELERAVACVGRIDDPGAAQGYQGTGSLIGRNLVLTNRHVLQAVAACDEQGGWCFNPGVCIDFGHEFLARASVDPRALRRVAFCPPDPVDPTAPIDHAKLDLVLIELEQADAVPRHVLALDIADDWAQPSRASFIVGYPADPGFAAFPPTLLERLFRSLFGFKRLAPGLVMRSELALHPWTFAHDATTLGGNSGSSVLLTGREHIAAGIHYGGKRSEPRENWGHILGMTLERTDAVTKRTLRHILEEYEVVLVDSMGNRAATSCI